MAQTLTECAGRRGGFRVRSKAARSRWGSFLSSASLHSRCIFLRPFGIEEIGDSKLEAKVTHRCRIEDVGIQKCRVSDHWRS